MSRPDLKGQTKLLNQDTDRGKWGKIPKSFYTKKPAPKNPDSLGKTGPRVE